MLRETMTSFRVAWRGLARAPSYSLVVVATLALGIGLNTTVFSLVNPYFVRELPFAEPDRLVHLGHVDPVHGWDGARFSLAQLADLREHAETLASLAGYFYGNVNLSGDRAPEQTTAGYTTANAFDVLGTPPSLGRTFVEGEEGPGAPRVVVLGHDLWTRRYGGDRSLVGETITVDREPTTVIGVMPPGFDFPFGEVELWMPMPASAATQPRQQAGTLVFGRLAEGSTPEAARVELDEIHRDLAAAHPDADGRFSGISVKSMREALNFAYDAMRAGFAILLAAVGLVLLIACVNVAGLTLARVAGRTREVAVRAALGAGRARLLGQFLVEGALLASAGGVLGLAASSFGVRFLAPRVPTSLFRSGEVTIDGNVLLFSAVLTLTTPFLFSLVPALAASRRGLTDSLREGASGGGASRSALRARRLLVVAEVALAIVLLAAAGLMVRSFANLQGVDLGFSPERAVTVEVSLPESAYPDAAAIDAYYRRAEAALAALPTVASAGSTAWLPLNHETSTVAYARPGDAPDRMEEWPVAVRNIVSESYFETLGIPLQAGRVFRESDDADAPRVIVLSRTLAARLWPGEPAVGRTLLLGDADPPSTVTVAGVVGDVRHAELTGEEWPQAYVPFAQGPQRRRRFLVATAEGSPAALGPAVREKLLALDPELPFRLRPMPEIVAENAIQWSLPSTVLSLFGIVALALSALGIYGLVAYSAATRRRELGIRLALGARSAGIRALVLREGVVLSLAGLGVGLVLALLVGRLLAGMLLGVPFWDPPTLLLVAVLIPGTAVLASLSPALRASRVAPASVLREE